jgi:glutathione S-transferase
MVTIYGSPKTSSGRCFWALEESGVKYETKSINMREKEHKSQEFLKINPNGKIPVLTDGDYTVWESMGINMYIAEKYKPELMGLTPEVRGQVYQWSIWSSVDLQPPLIDIFIQQVFVPEERRDLDKIEKAKAKLPELFNTIEIALKDNQYLAGDTFTMADLNTASVLHVCEAINYDFSEYKNINLWLNSIHDRKAFQAYKKLRD